MIKNIIIIMFNYSNVTKGKMKINIIKNFNSC